MLNGKKKSHLEARASLKQKMLKSGPLAFIEVTAAELSITLSPEFPELIEEVRQELKEREVKAAVAKQRAELGSESGLAAMAGYRHPMEGLSRDPEFTKEPDHKAHLERQERSEPGDLTFEQAVRPLIRYHFGLSYCSYYTVPRLALQEMPRWWQWLFCFLVNMLPETPTYTCQRRDKKGHFIKNDPWANYRRGSVKDVQELECEHD
jgi:hypothetical protein